MRSRDMPPASTAANAGEAAPPESYAAEAAEPEVGRPSRPADIVCQLWFEQFKQVGWLGVTAAGGGLVLLQAGYLAANARTGIAIAACAFSAVCAVLGQIRLVDRITTNHDIDHNVRALLYIALVLLAAGAGLFLGILTPM